MRPQSGTVRIQPFAQLGPGTDEGFAGDFDEAVGLFAVRRFAVAAFGDDQAGVGRGEDGDEAADGDFIAEGQQFAEGDAALGVLGTFAGMDEAEEGAATELLIVGGELAEDFVGAAFERALESADAFVGVVGEAAAVALVPEFEQGVLQERQRAGLAGLSARSVSTRPGSNSAPARVAGVSMARRSSVSVIGPRRNWCWSTTRASSS